MTSLRFARQLLLMLAAVSAMVLGACHDDGLITPPENSGDTCCAVLRVAVTSSRVNGGLAGVSVALRKGMDVVKTQVTNGDGVATFNGVCNSEYNVRLTKDGYSVAERGDIRITGCDTTRVSIAMTATTPNEPDSCCTSVLRIIPTNAQGTAIAGASVKITGPNGVARTLESTLDGVVFRELCRGTYVIRIAREGYKVNESSVTVGCGTEATERRMLSAATTDSCCSGRLSVGARDAATGALLSGAVVKLWKNGQVYRTATINDRPVVFDGLCQGGYGYSILREGYRAVEGEVTISCNGVAEVVRTLERVAQDSCCRNIAVIHVIDAGTRRPVANASVKLMAGGAVRQTVRTNADGVARFDGLCVGTYAILVEREGYKATDPRINVVCGQTAELTVVLAANTVPPPDTCCNASLTLAVLDGNLDREVGLAGVHVIIKYGGTALSNGVTNADGVYTRGQLCGHRTYEVVLEREGYRRMAFELPIGDCTAIRKSVRMMPN